MNIYRILYYFGSIVTECFIRAENEDGAIAEFERRYYLRNKIRRIELYKKGGGER